MGRGGKYWTWLGQLLVKMQNSCRNWRKIASTKSCGKLCSPLLAAGCRAGTLKATLNQQPSPCHLREVRMSKLSSPNPCRETARVT